MSIKEKLKIDLRKNVIFQTTTTFILAVAFMSIYQVAKFYLLKDLTLFQSNVITVIFASIVAAIAVYFILRDHNKLITEINKGIAERRKIYQESSLNNSLLEATLESTIDGFLVVNKNKQITRVNKKFIELWSIPNSIIEFNDTDKLFNFISAQLSKPKEFFDIEQGAINNPTKETLDTLELKDGRIFELYSMAQKLENQIVGRVWSFQDITDRKEAEKKLQENVETYKAIFHNSSDGMFLMSDVFIDCNDSVCNLFNCSKEDIIGKSPIVFSPEIQPDGRESSISAKNKIENAYNGKPQRFYWQHKRKDGVLFDAEVSLTAIIIGGKKLILAIVRDITENKRAQNIREVLYQISEAAYTASDMIALYKKIHEAVSLLMPAINFYIAIYDEKTDMVSFPYMVDEFDPPYPPKKAGNGLTEYILRKGEATLIDEKLDLELREAGEVELIGTPTLIWLGVPLKVEGKTIGVIVVQDYHKADTYGEEEKQILVFVAEQIAQVIERKRNAEAIKKFSEELKELNTTKDKFFSIIAHDLKNPFITIMGFSDILLADYNELSDEERKYYIEEMKKSADLSHDLLQNLLQWSRAQTGRIDYQPEKLNLLETIEENFVLIKKSAENKMIELNHNISKDVFVNADEAMLNTVFRNLLTNAIKFSNKNGKISVTVSDNEYSFLINVRDTGIGMNKERVNALFKLDSTNSTAGTSGEAGTGLGLILCKEFIEKHGGKIWVESEEGKGSTFSFTLPKFS
ncbi:ggdef domain protein [hydrocarbon metagenome]|uniref:histidine kinase n=1 Tax=hydrocarbon metagenome TaxID=938273 RepID=A0A0W8FW91_9ZZZZ